MLQKHFSAARQNSRVRASSQLADDPSPSAQKRTWPKWSLRLSAAVGIPLALLLVCEGALRLADYGYSSHFFLSRKIGGETVWIENHEFGRRFFPPGLERAPNPLKLPATKQAEDLRVFVLGESAAMGDPDFKFGLPRMLAVLLRERFPDRRIQVVNAGMVAINSHVILPIATDCARQGADLWVVYMGNNEMVGPFGAASVFGARAPALGLVRGGLWLKTTRVGQLLDAIIGRVQQGTRPLPEWGGMEMMAERKVAPRAASTARVYRNFERNLDDILTAGTRAGVPIILCTVPTNLKDCAPFAAVHRAELTAAELDQWQTSYQQGVALQEQGSLTNAVAAYHSAAQIDSEFADLAFRQAECWRLTGQNDQALSSYRQARDADALQFRADKQINSTIRKASTTFVNRGVQLVDAEEIFATNSPAGLTGSEFFYEHVHLTPEGNYLLARSVAEQAARMLRPEEAGRWVSESECFSLLGLTDWNRYDALNTILDRIQSAPFTHQLNHARELQSINEQMAHYRLATKPAQVHTEAAQLLQLVSRYPEDPDLRWNLAALLQVIGDNPRAEEQWRTLMRLQPQSALPPYNLGKLLADLGRESEAASLFGECLALDPQYHPARYALGKLCLKLDRVSDAIRHLRLTVQRRPNWVEARVALLQAFSRAGKERQAEQQRQAILQLDPKNPIAQQSMHN